jgi:hypothetical protein
MKTKLIAFVAIYAALASSGVLGSGQTLDASYPSYVVIGAFAIRDHASIWVENAKKMNFNAASAINPARNLYYVYVLHTLDRETAVIEANRIRKGSPYSDTWVYTGVLGIQAVAAQGSDANPVTGQPIFKVEIQDAAAPVKPEESTAASTVTAPGETPPGTVQNNVTPVKDAEAGSQNFLFKIFTANDQRELAGGVDVLDVEKGKKVASYPGNQNVVIRPVNKSGNISLVCEVFGYRKMQQNLNFNRPQETEGIVTEGNQTVVPFFQRRRHHATRIPNGSDQFGGHDEGKPRPENKDPRAYQRQFSREGHFDGKQQKILFPHRYPGRFWLCKKTF